jgi:enterochelin esterase-like enzyme
MELDGPISHPVDAPPTMTFETMSWDHTPMYGGPSNAVVATPVGLAAGERVPLIVLLPGGAANMQGAVTGFWSWWSEYMLGDTDVALHRGTLTEKDFQNLVRPDELAYFNRLLATTPYRGAVYVTPWVVGRQLDPSPHGHMVAEFLRDLVARVRAKYPVLPSREATGLGGMSSGGMWTLYSGSLCADLFGTLVAEQPFTDDLVPPLHDTVVARSMPQRVRIVTSVDDHQKKSTTALSEWLKKDGIDHDFVEYLGSHSAQFAAGPGGIDALVYFDRVLRGENLDGTKPLPEHDGLAHEVAVRPDRSRAPLDGARDKSSGVASAITWTALGVGATATGIAWARAKRRASPPPEPARTPAPSPAPTPAPAPAQDLPITVDLDDS